MHANEFSYINKYNNYIKCYCHLCLHLSSFHLLTINHSYSSNELCLNNKNNDNLT